MKRRISVAFLFVAMSGASPSRYARADVDISGSWFAYAGFDTCRLEFTRNGTALTASGSCGLAGSISGSGLFDTTTGYFCINGTTEGDLCTTVAANATVAADGTSFTGTVICSGGLGVMPLTGSNCTAGLLCATDDALREGIAQSVAEYQRIGLIGLLHAGAADFRFVAPSSGSLAVTLYKFTRGFYGPVLAHGEVQIETAGEVVMQLELTRRGRRLLRQRRRLGLSVDAAFTGPDGALSDEGVATIVRQP
jgi:hypothetical protein